MLRLRIRSVALALGCAVVLARSATLPSAEWKLPPLDGELAGEFTPLMFAGAPKLQWKLSFRTTTPRERRVEFAVDGPGTRLRGEAQLDPMGEGTWHIAEAQIDLAQWMPSLLPAMNADLGGLSIAGSVTATGEGTWRAGVVGGHAVVSLRDGHLDDPAHKLVLDGFTLDLEVADLAARRTATGQILTWRNGRYDIITLGTGRLDFSLNGDEVRVNEAAIDVFGGELKVGSIVTSTQHPEFSVTAQMSGVAVDQILFLLPPVLAEAHGRLDGELFLSRDAAGIQIGAGRLALREGETADLRLTPTPGLLSASLPPAVLKVYPGLAKMEVGGIPLRAELLEIIFSPQGDADGRTASVHVAGGPSDPALKAPIDLTVNVHGSLESLVKFGTNSRLHFGGER